MHANSLNGGGGRRQVLSSVDFYRRVPRDLTEVSCLCYLTIDRIYQSMSTISLG